MQPGANMLSPFEEVPGIHYHAQEDDRSCGAACAQMVLEGVGTDPLTQSQLEGEIRANNVLDPTVPWVAAPDGLASTLNGHRPSAFPSYFSVVPSPHEDTVARKMVWTMHNYKVAPLALIRGISHWVVVSGFVTSAAPTGPADLSYSIVSFDVCDPDSPGPGPSFVLKNIAYAASWQSYLYMQDAISLGYWQGKFVAICDSDPPPARVGKPPPQPRRLNGKHILARQRVSELTLAGIREEGLLDRAPWRDVFAHTTPGEPYLVQRLDRLDEFYYLVPMGAGPEVVPAVVVLDARFGNYLEAARIQNPQGDALQGLSFDPKAVLPNLIGQEIKLGRGKLTVRKQAQALYPTLVWRPCRESQSPYLPFFMVTVGNHRIYVRVDGEVFTKLHTHDLGN